VNGFKSTGGILVTTWNQWIPLLGIFAIVAGLYYLGKWFDKVAERGASLKKRRLSKEDRKRDRDDRREKLREDLEDKLWLRNERKRILAELKKGDIEE